MPDSTLSSAERALLTELQRRNLRFMIVGMSAALLQGARGATEDIDLWIEDPTDPRVAEAVRAAGGIWISRSFGMGPPRIGGDELSERFDVVVHMSGAQMSRPPPAVAALQVTDFGLPRADLSVRCECWPRTRCA